MSAYNFKLIDKITKKERTGKNCLKIYDLNLDSPTVSAIHAKFNDLAAHDELKDLDLSIERLDRWGLDHVQAFIEGISKLENLQKLAISGYTEKGWSHSQTIAFCKALANLRSLQVLSIAYLRLGDWDLDCVTAFGKTLAKLENLQELRLPFHNLNEWDTLRVVALCKGLKKRVGLRKLDCSGNDLGKWNQQNVSIFSSALFKLENLEFLDFSRQPIQRWDTPSIAYFSQALANLVNLQNLVINQIALGSWNVTHLNIFSNALLQLSNLRELSINYNGFGHTILDFKVFFNVLGELISLRKLDMSSNALYILPAGCINALSQSITKLSSLEELDISDNKLERFPEEAVIPFCSSILTHVSLKTLKYINRNILGIWCKQYGLGDLAYAIFSHDGIKDTVMLKQVGGIPHIQVNANLGRFGVNGTYLDLCAQLILTKEFEQLLALNILQSIGERYPGIQLFALVNLARAHCQQKPLPGEIMLIILNQVIDDFAKTEQGKALASRLIYAFAKRAFKPSTYWFAVEACYRLESYQMSDKGEIVLKPEVEKTIENTKLPSATDKPALLTAFDNHITGQAGSCLASDLAKERSALRYDARPSA